MPLQIPDFLVPHLAKAPAVLGGGRSGEAVLALLEKLGAKGVLYDEKLKHAKHVFTATQARAHPLVIFSPGFTANHKWLAAARKAGCETLGELDFASLFWRGKIIAVTGTNGKTTLTEFLTHALRSIKRDTTAAGNVGFPFSALVNRTDGGTIDDTAVVEVSSFQSESFKYFRADSALWINFAEDHLERHQHMRDYFDAKWRLLDRSLGGIILAGDSVQRHAAEFGCALPPDACVATENQPADILLAGTIFEHYPQRENFLIAAAWWRHAGLPEQALYAAAQNFKLGRHRLQRVAEVRGVSYWNDSKATNFHAVEAALSQFPSPAILIAGGLSKGGDIPGFVRRIAPSVKHALLIGATSGELSAACRAYNVSHTACATFAEAVKLASKNAQSGDHVLLSPGFASFDMFTSYEDRGDQFEQLVAGLAAAPASKR
ncbi:UDP-N-acetylmuramoylalanine--D-glutamate ligase [Ereboglobus sp. PH5-5]|uniref:UDP-N-acetylmuramoyl-L-alanine--D-glutamate ligase n=1 Tax=Ereboglobus sp. PH5-5 TaxID=2940529 RepID=UPI002405D1C4|nr:UDP-N-acetylmuramoyl-L-alanine--D-glutamate ligase [Ereboglobus sp. PH5-5]MDF9833241.1 UDP-N-acetylmuramoylalanine--D-glutamate ligase [Ereboglobus sp. PH5-5]